jgi:hypothetical protein
VPCLWHLSLWHICLKRLYIQANWPSLERACYSKTYLKSHLLFEQLPTAANPEACSCELSHSAHFKGKTVSEMRVAHLVSNYSLIWKEFSNYWTHLQSVKLHHCEYQLKRAVRIVWGLFWWNGVLSSNRYVICSLSILLILGWHPMQAYYFLSFPTNLILIDYSSFLPPFMQIAAMLRI